MANVHNIIVPPSIDLAIDRKRTHISGPDFICFFYPYYAGKCPVTRIADKNLHLVMFNRISCRLLKPPLMMGGGIVKLVTYWRVILDGNE